ncbi:apolipoprotein N-acyltransferase [Croceicoccus estronivorus]|nr:apolipoprotein N-acyltransferase [Croceicoccus estronivorus]
MALLLGAISATGFQPLALWPLTLIAVGVLFLLIAGTGRIRDAWTLGWLFGWTHFTLGNNWIATAFTYQAEMPALLGWLAVPLLALYLAVYPGLAAAAAKAIAGKSGGWSLAFAFAGCWIVAEWLRGWVFTGYAWNPLGVVLLGNFDSQGLAFLAPWLGTYALSGMAALIAAGGAVLAARKQLLPLAAAVAVVIAGWFLPAPAERPGKLALTLVQPDVRQEELNDPRRFEAQFARIASLSIPERRDATRLVLWPESGVPDYLRDGYPQRFYQQMTAGGDPAYARARIGRVIGPQSLLMTGAVDLEIADGQVAGARNVVTAIDGQGHIRAGYAKAHLVPFGEYLALRWLLEPLGATRLVAGALDFWPGPGPRTLDLGRWGKAGIQICYEITFSGEVTDPAARPDYIFNPSNDGWFGSWGPPQHLAQARLRAIEEGLPVLRATTTGISAVIDAHGIVRHHVPRHRAERIDTYVPEALPPTLFAQWGNRLALGWAIALLLIALVARRIGRG